MKAAVAPSATKTAPEKVPLRPREGAAAAERVAEGAGDERVGAVREEAERAEGEPEDEDLVPGGAARGSTNAEEGDEEERRFGLRTLTTIPCR